MFKHFVLASLIGLASCAPAAAQPQTEAFVCKGVTLDGEDIVVAGVYDLKDSTIFYVGPVLALEGEAVPVYNWENTLLKEVTMENGVWNMFAVSGDAGITITHPNGSEGKTLIELGFSTGYKTSVVDGSCEFKA